MAYDYLNETGTSRIFSRLKGWLEENAGGKRASRLTIGTTANGWAKKDCDYLCDGTADDVEINAAISALPATGGEVVLLDGTYNLAATIQINKAGVTLSGNGAATKLVRGFSGNSNNKAIIYMNMTNCVVRGIAVDGVKASYYAGIYNQGIESFGNKNTIEDCIIENVHSNAAYVYGDYHVVRNVRATGCGCGVNASGENNIVNGCVSTKNDTGVYVSGDHNVVAECVCLENDIGIEVNEGSYNIINGNVSRVSSENNILIDGSNHNVITDNDFSVDYGDGVTPSHAIRINDSYCIGNTVADNTVGDGVFFDAGNDTLVGGKIVTGTYTGNGAINRTITLGFKPRFVWVFVDGYYHWRCDNNVKEDTAWWVNMAWAFVVDGTTRGGKYRLNTDLSGDYVGAVPVDDGFVVMSGTNEIAQNATYGTNASGKTYCYFAIQ